MNGRGALAMFGEFARNGLGVPVLVMTVIAMMVLPLPAFLLDVFFTFNISLSLLVLLAVIYVRRALEFATFPTVLLGATLLRLGLNVASTRIVLMNGHTGAHAAGRVIAAFGQFVVGGNYAVGLVVFVVLVIINFVVITKGAGRISEVSARFTLDAMPGRQMAIDADLNAGIITPAEAIIRRQEVREEADFYGAMDGASKFVRGDAVAAILIVFINLFGGTIIGAVQHGLPVADAARTYALLTIGDGLVAQIPALLLSVAVAILVTRVSRAHDMGQQIMSQILGQPRALGVTCGILALLGIIPGMPNLVFLSMAAGCGVAAFFLGKQRTAQKNAADAPAAQGTPLEQRELSWDDVEPVDLIGLEVGYRLIPLVDRDQGGELMARIKGVRKKLSEELGFLVQPVHIRDNLELGPNSYRITILGAPVGESEVFPDREMAIDPGQVSGTLTGTSTKDPAFGLPAVWIEKSRREQAQSQGYTVVDASSVIATHSEPFAAMSRPRAAGPRGSTTAAQSLGQDRAQAHRGSGTQTLADERRGQGTAAFTARTGTDPQLAHRMRGAGRARAEDTGSVGAGGGGSGRARPQHRAKHRWAARGIASHHARCRAGTGAAGFHGRGRRWRCGVRARTRRPRSTGAGRQRSSPGSRRRAGRRAGGAQVETLDSALDALFHAHALGAVLQRDSRKSPHPRDSRGRALTNS